MLKILLAIFVLFAFVLASAQSKPESAPPNLGQLNIMIARFAPTQIRVDTSHLINGDQQALAKLIQAARILNPLFMRQLWSQNLATYDKVKLDRTPLGEARAHYYWINKNPWSELDEHRAFLPGVPPQKLPGANFYPENMTKSEFEDWLKTLSKDEQDLATGFFTVIRRDTAGKLRVVPYNQEYQADLEKAAALLREAAALTPNASLKKFLNSRAAAFLSNDYYQSDIDWMDLDAPIDITIGPYETYNDELFGYKAAFEAYVNLRDDAETNKLAAFAKHLQEIEDNLPEDPQYRTPKLGAAAPIRVVNEVFSSGDGEKGVQSAAYNLPNDDRVVQLKGSKRVMLRNIQEAKFRSVLIPIARRALAPQQQADVSFEPFFTHILAHELMHGLGPHQIIIAGRETNPRLELKEVYSAIEEAKADVTGLFALQYMMDHAKEMDLTGILPADEAAERQLYTTFLASAFRSLRFGLNEAHGKGMALQFNYLMARGAFVARPDGTFGVDFQKIKPAVRDLTHELLTLEATGDHDGAKQMLDNLAVLRPAVKAVLDKLQGVPVDIEPQFVTANEIAPDPNAPAPSAPAPPPKRKAGKQRAVHG
ncbi:MAG TPA: hypothetical protein VEG30_02825 [Terriglobales bacterium]|nr:hypothetical protein [Terriglobales bacterium]